MKKCFWLLVFFGFVFFSLIIRDFYVKNSENFDFIIHGSRTKGLLKVVGDVAKLTETPSIIQVVDEKSPVKVDRSAIFLFGTYESYNKFHDRLALSNKYPKEVYFFVYIAEEKTENLKGNVEAPKIFLHTEVFLIGHRNFYLKSAVTFQQPSCNLWKRISVNHFSETKKTWVNGMEWKFDIG
jgi:hypothetical protein